MANLSFYAMFVDQQLILILTCIFTSVVQIHWLWIDLVVSI